MEETRGQIRSTVEELRDRVNERLDWRHYVDRYPGSSLTAAVESDADTVAKVIAEVATTRITERGATRGDDKFSEAAMEDRKREGYF